MEDLKPVTRRMFTALFAAIPQLHAIRRKPDIRSTGAYKAAMSLRRNLEEMGLYDDMPENWQEVEKAIGEGCMNFTTGVSRMVRNGQSPQDFSTRVNENVLYLYRVLPIKAQPNEHGWFEKWPMRR